MSGDPADIGGAPIDIVVVIIEDILMGHGGEDHVAAGGVQHALRFAGGARGVEDEHRVFRVHLLGRAVGRSLGHRVMVPNIAALYPVHGSAGVPDDDTARHLRAFLPVSYTHLRAHETDSYLV